jgi:UDP-N-acetylglucosamine:LPS N-acetylglucosamine transferase
MRVLIPYFLAGSGHLVSAEAISAYLRSKEPDWDIRLLEPADEFESKELDEFFRRNWQVVLKNPRFGAFAFTLMADMLPFIPIAISNSITKRVLPAAAQFVREYAPDLILTTHWGCGHLFQAVRSELSLDVPLFLVRNDLGGAYQIQVCGADTTFVMSHAARQAFLDLGLTAERVAQVNLLVRPQFLHGSTKSEEVRRELGVPKDAFALLLSAGGEGFVAVREIA